MSCYIRVKEGERFVAPALCRSLFDEELPILDFVRVSNQRRNWQLLRCSRRGQKLEASLVWEAVCLLLVHFLGRPDQVLPGVLSSAGARHDVVRLPSSGRSALRPNRKYRDAIPI